MRTNLLTAKETALYLRTTPGALANLRLRGDGPPYVKMGRRVLYDQKDLEAWIDSHKVRTK
ncbi:helix-turn-helix domain-containing protein [Desulfatibacillum alkenivorans]|uniref:helix-turn-helix transcriptional regulator n=1 Tax=Desulfatibacillum alkenivorans TaxID=259354 RepID=UPI000936CED3